MFPMAQLRRLGILLGLAVVWTASVTHSAVAARTPIPFTDAYRDGYTFIVWQEATTTQINAQLDRIAKAGARHLSIPYWGCQSDIHSADVGSCEISNRIGAPTVARLALAKGFSVTFLPIVLTQDWKWRGFFDPKDVKGWFRTYGVWIKKVAREAKALGMKELVVSTETTQLYKYEAEWKSLVAELRTEFSGPLILTVNWGDTEHSFWEDVDAIGISAYYPLSVNPNPGQQELDDAWKARHDEFVVLSQKWNRPIHITEVGYTSTTAAARTPWNAGPDDTSDFTLQAR
jgi:hypothetical protein